MSSLKSPINTIMDWDSFSHGQIQSKLWLCKELERHLPNNARVAILGSWHNVLSFMLLTRDSDRYQEIVGIDLDKKVQKVADKITIAWRVGGESKVTNIIADAGKYDLSGYNVVINCSPEHMLSNDWYHNISSGTLVCIQSSDITVSDDEVWKCVNPNKSTTDLVQKYPLSQFCFLGSKKIQYDSWGYNRFMFIGFKG